MSISARTIDTNYPPSLMLLFLHLWAGRCVWERRSAVSFIHHACLHMQRRPKERRTPPPPNTRLKITSIQEVSFHSVWYFRFSQWSCDLWRCVVSIVSEKYVVSFLMSELYRKDAGPRLPDHTMPYPKNTNIKLAYFSLNILTNIYFASLHFRPVFL